MEAGQILRRRVDGVLLGETKLLRKCTEYDHYDWWTREDGSPDGVPDIPVRESELELITEAKDSSQYEIGDKIKIVVRGTKYEGIIYDIVTQNHPLKIDYYCYMYKMTDNPGVPYILPWIISPDEIKRKLKSLKRDDIFPKGWKIGDPGYEWKSGKIVKIDDPTELMDQPIESPVVWEQLSLF